MPQVRSKAGVSITAEVREGIAYMRLVDTISEYGEASSATVRSQVDSFLSQGVTKAELYANGRGGDCFEATEISNELERFGNENVSLRIGALAASAYSYLIAKFKTTANPNSQIMIHKPLLGTYGNIDSIKADTVLLENTTALYRTAYAQKTGKTEDEIDTIWGKGDVWLTAQEALDMGLIDAIAGDEELVITAEVRTMLEACGAPVVPELSATTITENIMKRELIIAALGLDADATDEQIEQAIKDNKAKADAAAKQEETAEEKAEKAAKALVAKHIKRKALKADLAESYEGWAKHDFAGCEKALEAMTPIPALSALLNTGAPTAATLEARATWNFDKWQDEDPKGLQALHDEQPEEFTKLFNQKYK